MRQDPNITIGERPIAKNIYNINVCGDGNVVLLGEVPPLANSKRKFKILVIVLILLL